MLLQKVRYQQTAFGSRQPRQAMAEVGILFYCQFGVSPLPERSEELTGTEEWRARPPCKVTTSLPAGDQGYILYIIFFIFYFIYIYFICSFVFTK